MATTELLRDALYYVPIIKAEIADYLDTPGYCEHGVNHWATMHDCACGWCEAGEYRNPYSEALGRAKRDQRARRERSQVEQIESVLQMPISDSSKLEVIKVLIS